MRIQNIELTTRDIARVAGQSRQRIAQFVQSGRITPLRKERNTFVFHLSELEKILPEERYARLLIRIKERLMPLLSGDEGEPSE